MSSVVCVWMMQVGTSLCATSNEDSISFCEYTQLSCFRMVRFEIDTCRSLERCQKPLRPRKVSAPKGTYSSGGRIQQSRHGLFWENPV